MPWHIESDNPDCTGFAVVKDDTGEVEGCHASEPDAEAQLAALYASEADRAAVPPRDGIRAVSAVPAVDDAETGPRISGHFARFNTFNEIDSAVEGRFLERIMPGAFRKTLAESRGRIRMLFQHGRDPNIGDKPIGAPDVLREDEVGPYFEAGLFPSVPPLVVDGLRAGQYGISYRFSVINEDWDPKPRRSDVNPHGLPERTIREAKVWEFGPVTFPADHGADYAVRSVTLTDLDAAPGPFVEEAPALPSDGAEAPPHSDEGSREAEAITEPEKENALMEYITPDEKRARVRELTERQTARAAEYTGVMPDEVQRAWDEDDAEIDRLNADIAAHEARMRRLQSLVADDEPVRPARTEPGYVAPTIIRQKSEADIYDLGAIRKMEPEQRDQRLRDNAMRSVEQVTFPHFRADQDGARGYIASLLDYHDTEDKELARRILVTGSPQYRRDFNRYIATGGAERGTALAVGVDGTGGYAVPYAFDPTVIAIGAHTSINPYRQACRVVSIVGTDTWQALTSTAITAAWALEAAAATEQGPTFARPEFVAKRAHAFVTVSYEMAQDRPDLPAELSVLFQEAKDTLEENSFTVGAGTTVYPQGMGLKDAFTRVDSITNDTIAVGDLYATEAALPIRHRMNAAWFLSRAAIRGFQAFETTGGQLFNGVNYAATPNPATNRGGNTGLTLLGYPIWETPSMPYTPTTDDTTVGVLCDPVNYVILDRVGMSVKVIPDMLNGATPSFPTGEVGIYAFWRGTARVLNADGGRQLAVQ